MAIREFDALQKAIDNMETVSEFFEDRADDDVNRALKSIAATVAFHLTTSQSLLVTLKEHGIVE